MAITSRDGWIASAKQRVPHYRTVGRTTVAGGWFSVRDLAGNPGAGTLAIGNTANGIVPTDAIAGFPVINAFGASATGHIARVGFNNTVISQMRLYDCVFAAGAYAFNANTTLTSIPSYAGRMPGGSYNGLEIWVEQVTAATGNQAVNVTYTNAPGSTGRTTGAVGIAAAPTVGRCWQLPFQAGDSGIQQITNITGSVASAGTFNVLVLRQVWEGYVSIAGGGGVHNMLETMMEQVYTDSALFMMVMAPTGTSSGAPYTSVNIVNG